jgi:N-acetylmuramic acid 6-phosphate etherase
MSDHSDVRSRDFLKISDQFRLGELTTEASHPVTARLSETARRSVAEGLRELFIVDRDVLKTYGNFADSDRAQSISTELACVIRNGGRVFFTGCGSTGRLSIQLVSIWRHFWRHQQASAKTPIANEMEHRAFSVMAGGDFALIKSVEGFEDFVAFGRKQLDDLGVRKGDVVFAITEGGETSFVIGTAWAGLEAGARVFFVYNNPDDVLCGNVERSRQVIQEPRIAKLNLTTGPMGITGSTRMQATSIQLSVMLTILEMTVRDLLQISEKEGIQDAVPAAFAAGLQSLHATLQSTSLCTDLARLVTMEEATYRSGKRNNYFAGVLGIDVLTDTTERSPTYCTPPFRKHGDSTATESWAFLFVPHATTEAAWEHILGRQPKCVAWCRAELQAMVEPDKLSKCEEVLRKIGCEELMRFKIGMDGLHDRLPRAGDSAIAIMSEADNAELTARDGKIRHQLETAAAAGARVGLIVIGRGAFVNTIQEFARSWMPACIVVPFAVPETGLLLDGVTRVGVKMLLNALSTTVMVRLGRVMGNYMIWVVPSNLKLIDRATRYVQRLANLEYPEANRLLFEVLEYVEPRMKLDQAYPPVVGMAVLRARESLSNAEAEQRLRTAGFNGSTEHS